MEKSQKTTPQTLPDNVLAETAVTDESNITEPKIIKCRAHSPKFIANKMEGIFNRANSLNGQKLEVMVKAYFLALCLFAWVICASVFGVYIWLTIKSESAWYASWEFYMCIFFGLVTLVAAIVAVYLIKQLADEAKALRFKKRNFKEDAKEILKDLETKERLDIKELADVGYKSELKNAKQRMKYNCYSYDDEYPKTLAFAILLFVGFALSVTLVVLICLSNSLGALWDAIYGISYAVGIVMIAVNIFYHITHGGIILERWADYYCYRQANRIAKKIIKQEVKLRDRFMLGNLGYTPQ